MEDRRVRVRLLGAFEVEGVSQRDLGSRKGRLLLKVLAAAGGTPVPVDRLAEVVWGDDQPARPADQVGVLISRLRGVLGAHRLPRSDAGYALVADWSDVAALQELSTAAAEALEGGRVGAARAAADAALALARGPLLADEDGLWVEADRVAAQAAVTRLRRLAVDAAVAAGDHGAAAALAEQALAADPYDEAVLRALMTAHLAAGRPASALAAYARVRHRLAEDLGVPPTAETEAVHAVALAAADGDAVGASPPPPPAAVSPASPAGLVVGRDAELAALDAALAEAARGGTALVVVEGDAGMGKTTLVEAWAGRAGAGATVLWGQCDELGRDLPLQPVADAVAGHLRSVGADRAEAVAGEDAIALAPLLGPVAGPAATVVADSDAGRARLFASLLSVLERAGEGGPTVLVLEDLHRAGASTLAWLSFARRRSRRTLIVVTTRAGGAAGVDASHRLRLGPLGRQAVAALVGPERSDALFERSGGHPLLLAALAQSPGEGDALPADLRDAIAAQVDGLGGAVAATLRVAAILGPECDLDLVAEVAGAPVVAVLDHLEAAARAGLLADRGGRFAFRHQLVREGLEAAAGAARRALVHREAARLLAARLRPDPLAVALHARAGGDAELAAASFVAAAALAAGRFDLDAAEDHLAAALDLAETAEAFVARARLRMGRQALEAAATDAERAVALGGGAPALEVAGWVAYYRRRYDDALACAEAAAARAGDAAVRVSAQALAGRVLHGAGDLAAAIGHLEAVDGGPPEVRGVAAVWLAQVRVHQGRPLDALEVLAGPMADPDSLAHPWAPLHLRFNRALALGQLGRVAEALQVARDLGAAVARAGPVGARFTAPAANAEAWLLRWSGRGGEADDRNQAALAATGGDRGPSREALGEAYWVALLDLADGCLLRGDPAGAAALVERLGPLDTWVGTMAWHQRHRLGLLRARLALAGGDGATAAELASAVAADAAGRGAARYEFLARVVVALADPSVPDDEVAAAVDGLGRCAVLDGWPLVAALAAARRSDAWRAEAVRRAALVVAAAAGGDAAHGEAAGRFADRLLSS